MENIMENFEVVSSYSRAQALEDGVLGDISEIAREAGFKYPCAATTRLIDFLNDTEGRPWESFSGRCWDMLMIARLAARKGGSVVLFRPLFTTKRFKKRPVYQTLKMVCGPGDNGEQVITFMFPDED